MPAIKMDDIYLNGLITLSAFFALMLLVGLLAACNAHSGMEGAVLANRNMGIIVGAFAMTATWVGGDFICGAAQSVYNPKQGLLWAQVPLGYALSLLVGGALFARRMHSKNYITMLDPLQHRYGLGMGSILFIPALIGEIIWSAAILATFGSTVVVVLGLDELKSIVAAACVTALYTAVGGVTSIAYTAVLQLLCVFVGLWITAGYAIRNDAVTSFADSYERWMGAWSLQHTGVWIDTMLVLTLGRVPWQAVFQRILSSKTPARAQILLVISSLWCLFMAAPAILIGVVAASTDWSQISLNGKSVYITSSSGTSFLDKSLVVPMVFRHLIPQWVSVIALVAFSAAVTSSVDSSFLAASSMFAHNLYKMLFRPMAYETEVVRVMRISIFFLGACTTAVAVQVKSVFSLWYLSADITYVILFPQVFCALCFPSTNKYGSFIGFIVGLVLRITGGEPALNIPVFIEFPFFSQTEGQLFPFKTTAMLASIISIIAFSFVLNMVIKTKARSSYYMKQSKINRGSCINDVIVVTDEMLNGEFTHLKESDV